jgi:HlyD family secretion protein
VDIDVGKAQVAQAQAALAQAQAGSRAEAIAASEADIAASEADAKASDADVASADAALKQAQATLADTELRAPFDGTIVTVNIKQGQTTPASNFAIRIADLARWKITTKDLTELSVSRLKVGNAAEIKFDAIPDLKLTGKVTRIDDFGTNRQGDIVYAVSITPDSLDPRLRWNMTASVTVKP